MKMNIKRMTFNAPGNDNWPIIATPLELHILKTGAINSYDAAKAKNLKIRATGLASVAN